jgi:site-specific DNA recombinase
VPTAIYLRISSDPHLQRAGVDRQRFDCEMMVAKRGWPEPEVFEDNDVSAWSGRRRPAWERMLGDLHRLDAIVAWDLDRLVRQPRDLERLLDACAEAGVSRVATAQGDLDLTSDSGRLHARIMAAVAAKESDDKSRRIKRAVRDRAERGQWTGGARVPFGYVSPGPGQLELSDDAPMVRAAYEHVLAGGSLAELVRRGGPKTTPGWRYLLLSPTLAGLTSTGDRGSWPALVDLGTWTDCKAMLEAPDRRMHRGTDRRHWLSGLLVCWRCDEALTRRARDGGHRYVCKGCRRTSIEATAVEQYVEQAILAAAPTVSAPPSLVVPPAEGGADDPLGSRLSELAAMYATGALTRAEWEAARAAVRAAEPPVPPRATPTPQLTAEAWASWDAMERHQAASWLLDRIVVGAGPAPTADRLQFAWVR